MDPATWTLKEWAETFSGPLVAVILLALNLRGTLWWKPQVDKLLATTVESATKLDVVRVEQINVERTDKIAWKTTCDELKAVVGKVTLALEEERRKVAALTIAVEDEKRRYRPSGA